MLFNSLEYLLFLPAVFAIYWLVPRQLKAIVLLVASYVFYMSWSKICGVLLIGMTVATYLLGLLLARLQSKTYRRLVLIGGITLNLGLLALFKYTNFILDALNNMGGFVSHLAHLGKPLTTGMEDLPIILPLGISFFVFEFIHYLVDIFQGTKPIKNPIRFGVFAAFFPSQIAGPIKRFQDFDPQLAEPAKFDGAMFQQGLILILQGLFKKVVLGDNLAAIVQAGYKAPTAMSLPDAWICIIAFCCQLYFDFSGYTDIGRGSALVLGYRLPENFNLPLLANNVKDFWRRWHMTLSNWLRDYVYIPLGGSRSGEFWMAANLLITMFLCGLWHGAAWHFVAFGMFHGFGLVVHRFYEKLVNANPALTALRNSQPYHLLSVAATFIFACLGFNLFRCENMTQGLQIFSGLVTGPAHSSLVDGSLWRQFWQSVLPVACTLYGGVFIARSMYERANEQSDEKLAAPVELPFFSDLARPIAVRVVLAAACAFMIVALAPHRSVPFIYFQF